MKTAGQQDTFDHMIGSGALSYSWWRGCKVTGVNNNGDVEASGWIAELTCEDGDGDDKVVNVTHPLILSTARKVLSGGCDASQATRRACSALIFDVDECDFDAATADEVLQLAVLGEIVFA